MRPPLPPFFVADTIQSSLMSQLLICVHPPPLAPLSVAAGWRNRDIPTKKLQCPCGKVLPIVQNPDSKACSVHCSGTQHTDWVRYGKVVPESFQGSISADTPLLGMLIRVDKHPQLLGAARVASTLAAASAAAVVRLGPIPQVPNLDADYAMDMDPELDAAIPLRERKCPAVLPRQAGTLQQLRRMYPVMRGNYEKPPWEFCDRRGLFALDCRTDGRWDDLAGRYGPCLPCLDLLSGKHAARLKGWMNTAVDPKDTKPHYRQGPHILSRRLNEANDRGYVAQETMGQLQEDLHQFRQRCETYKALAVAIAEDDRPLAGRRAARLLQAGWAPAKVLGHLCDAWSVQSWDDQDRDAAALAALGVGGPKLLQALNNAGYVPSYDTGRRHAEGAPRVRPNEPPGLPWLLEALGHIPGCHVWHLCIDEIHVEDVITVSGEAHAVGLCATCCRHPMPLASGGDVEALA